MQKIIGGYFMSKVNIRHIINNYDTNWGLTINKYELQDGVITPSYILHNTLIIIDLTKSNFIITSRDMSLFYDISRETFAFVNINKIYNNKRRMPKIRQRVGTKFLIK